MRTELAETIEQYDRTRRAYCQRPRALSASFTAGLPAGLVLDAGCGAGLDLDQLRRTHAAIGCDLSAGMLAEANGIGAPLVRCDLRALPFQTGSYAGVWAQAALVHLTVSEAAEALRELVRVTRPGGTVFFNVKAAADGVSCDATMADVAGRRWFHLWSADEIVAIVADLDADIALQASLDGRDLRWFEVRVTVAHQPAVTRTGGQETASAER